jgi:hypothetical protein
MSRLHSQKRRLRAAQRADGLIDPDSDQVDRDAFQEIGSTHQAARQALELVERTGASDDGDRIEAANLASASNGLSVTDASYPEPSSAARPMDAPAQQPATLGSSRPASEERYTTGESARLRTIVDGFMQQLSPRELEEVREHLERRSARQPDTSAPAPADPAQKPPTE